MAVRKAAAVGGGGERGEVEGGRVERGDGGGEGADVEGCVAPYADLLEAEGETGADGGLHCGGCDVVWGEVR